MLIIFSSIHSNNIYEVNTNLNQELYFIISNVTNITAITSLDRNSISNYISNYTTNREFNKDNEF